jgi:hypothetical protein
VTVTSVLVVTEWLWAGPLRQVREAAEKKLAGGNPKRMKDHELVALALAGDLAPVGLRLAEYAARDDARNRGWVLALLERAGVSWETALAAEEAHRPQAEAEVAAQQAAAEAAAAAQRARLTAQLPAAIDAADWHRVDCLYRQGAEFGWRDWAALSASGRASLLRRWRARVRRGSRRVDDRIRGWAEKAAQNPKYACAEWVRRSLRSKDAEVAVGMPSEDGTVRRTKWLQATVDRWLARWDIVHRVGVRQSYDNAVDEWVPADAAGGYEAVSVDGRPRQRVPQPGDFCEGGIVEAALEIDGRWALGCRAHTEASRRRWADERALANVTDIVFEVFPVTRLDQIPDIHRGLADLPPR